MTIAPLGVRRFSFPVLVLLCSILVARAQTQAPCLKDLRGDPANSKFDLDYDRNSEGGSFSCDVMVRASKARSVLEDFRYGFVYDSQPHLIRSIIFPLKITVAGNGSASDQVVSIKDVGMWLKFKATHFDPYERAMITCATLANVHIFKKWSGFSIGLGRVWFFNYLNSGLRVGQINVGPMSPELFRKSCLGQQ
jgi:hypothetical protein